MDQASNRPSGRNSDLPSISRLCYNLCVTELAAEFNRQGIYSRMRRNQAIIKTLILLLALWGSTAFAGDVFDGKRVYLEQCRECHGVTGRGEMPGAPNFTRGDRLLKTDRELWRAVERGSGIMPGFEGLLTQEEIENVVSYLRTFL